MRPPHADQMRELMGAANLSSTAEIKAAKKAAKASYAAELQAQMRANEEAKLRERMERLGIAPPPPLQAPPQGGMLGGGGPASPGGMGGGVPGFGQASPPGAPSVAPPPFQPVQPPQAFPVQGGLPPYNGSPGGGAAPLAMWSQPPPYQPQPSYPTAMPPPYQPPGPLGSLYGMPSPNSSPPPVYGGANGYGAQPPSFNSPPQPSFGMPGVGGVSAYGMPPQGRGYAPPAQPPPPLLPGPAPPPGAPGRDTLHRLEQQAKKDQYRLELEAQIREREGRKAAEKARQREEDMRKEAEMAAAAARDAMNRGGGGAPLRDAAGNVVANLRGAMPGGGMGMGMGGPMSPGGMGGMGMGPPPPPMGMGMGGMMPPPPLVGSPPRGGDIGGPMMMGGPPPFMGGGPSVMMGGPPSPSAMGPPPGMMGMGMGGPMGMDGGGGGGAPPGAMPNFRFRSDNPYITPKELDNKQRQARELQEALEQQIQEKRRAKELEKHRELAEMEREEARFRAGMEQQGQRGGPQDGRSGGDGRSKEDVLADAWEKARQEAEELRRNKFAAKRGAGGVSRGPGGGGGGISWADGPGDGPEPPPPLQSQNSSPPRQGGGGFGDSFPPPPPIMMGSMAVAAGRPSTPLVVEKVRQVAAAELAAVKQELVAEAAQLREVVAAQGQQVAALKSHAERMEAEAERAREQVTAIRLGLVPPRVGAAAAAPVAGGGVFGAAAEFGYDRQLALAAAPPPPVLADIDLDLPPTGAMLRRNAAPPPVYDLGPAIPAVNSSMLLMDNAAASSINAVGSAAVAAANGRPPSRLRAVNPLEASMAGESVFIYPNGREMARYPAGAAARAAAAAAAVGGAPSPQGLGPAGAPLPFQSIHMASGVGTGAADIPLVATSQELETGPVPVTPKVTGLASSAGPDAMAESIDASAAAAQSVAASVAISEAVGGDGGASEQQRGSGSPPGGNLGGAGGGGGAAAPMTPLDVDMVMSRNKEKLEMLKGITDLTQEATSIEALDEFLARYAAQRPGLPERTATPVLRICTPPGETAGAATAASTSEPGPLPPPLRNGTSLPPSTSTAASSAPLYSSRAKSVGPLPMGSGRVMTAGGLSTAGSAGGGGTLGGGSGSGSLGGGGGACGSSSIGGSTLGAGGLSGAIDGGRTLGSSLCGGSTLDATGSGRLPSRPPDALGSSGRVSRRNSFTGERSPQEGVLSQLLEPALRPKTGPEASSTGGGIRAASPMAGRPPMLPNSRYSNNGGGSRGGGGAAAGATSAAATTSGYTPSSRPATGSGSGGGGGSRPTTGQASAAGGGGGGSAASPTAASLPPSRPMRPTTRGSEDGSYAATSGWPSYNPSRETSAAGRRMSRSRSLSAHGEGGPAHEPTSVTGSGSGPRSEPEKALDPPALLSPPPPEDTLDVEMRKGLGTPPSGSATPGRGSSMNAGGEPATPPFQIPRSPMLAGARRTGSAASQRGTAGG